MDHGQVVGLSEEEAMLLNGVKVEEDVERSFFSDLAVLCSERLSQMTKTYDDVEAVKQLLEEKEKDLELAAKIGKSLLERNKELQQTNEFLEEQLNFATDQVTQLKHELQQKIDLLHIYTDNESADSGGSTPATERVTNLGLLQRKIRLVEEENVALKLEVNHIKTLTQSLEEKEQQLVTDFSKKLADTNVQNEILSAEVMEKQEQSETLQKQVNRLLKEMVEKTASEKLLRCENEELSVKLRAAQETQAELAQELLDLQERYAEVIAMLTESREEMKQMKDKVASNRYGSSAAADDSYYDSLASELEASDSGYSGGGRRQYYGAENEAKNESLRRQSQDKMIKVMETVRNSLQKQELKDAERQKALETSLSIPPLIISTPSDLIGNAQSSPAIDSESDSVSPRSAVHKAKGILKEVEVTLSPTGEKLSRAPSNESLCSYPAPGLGVPGIPGTKDLEFAIRRLSLRRRVELEFARYRSERGLAATPPSSHRPSLHGHPGQSAIPSASTTAASSIPVDVTPKAVSTLRQSSVPVPIRSRLMLVKPVEGSDTLAHWKELATPGGIDASTWEKRPGIKVKGGNGASPPKTTSRTDTAAAAIGPLSVDTTTTQSATSLCDSPLSSELDTSAAGASSASAYSSVGRQFSSTPGTFSFVNSQIMHPRDDTNVSVAYTALLSTASSTSSLSASPPRDDGTSTFSTALNLAQALGERCIDLVAGIGAGWWARQSPMTVPTWSAAAAKERSAKQHSSVEVMAKKDMVSGLGSLMEEDGPIVGLDQVKTVERSPEKRHNTGAGGVVTRAALKR